MSKLAQAGESSTASPGAPATAALRTACSMSWAWMMRHAAAGHGGFDLHRVAADQHQGAAACAASGRRRAARSPALAVAPRSAPPCGPAPPSAATVAPTLVPFESSYQATPSISAMRSTRCGRPRIRAAPAAAAPAAGRRRGTGPARPARWRHCAGRPAPARRRAAGVRSPCISQPSAMPKSSRRRRVQAESQSARDGAPWP
jgi:hypothetical protein